MPRIAASEPAHTGLRASPHDHSFLSVAVVKHPDLKTLREESVCLAYTSKLRSMIVGKSRLNLKNITFTKRNNDGGVGGKWVWLWGEEEREREIKT